MLICDFPAKWIPLKVADFVDYIKYAAGFECEEKDLWEVSDRIETTIRLFNTREGLSRKDDTLPPRALQDAMPEGATKGNYISREDLDTLLDKYYALRGWDKNGIPEKETIVKLGIEA